MNMKLLYTSLMMTTIVASSALMAAGSDDEGEGSSASAARAPRPSPQKPDDKGKAEEYPGLYEYDGNIVYALQVRVEGQDGETCAFRSRTGNLRGHEGNEVVHVDLCDIGDDMPLDPIGRYEYCGTFAGQPEYSGSVKKQPPWPHRSEGRLVYSGGQGCFYLPTVTQEIWKRGDFSLGAFVASYNEESDLLRFVRGSEIYKGNDSFWGALPRGLYHIVSVDETGPRRKEFWRYLHNGKPNVEGELYTLTSPLGCSSIPGLGGTAPRLVPFHSTDKSINELYKDMEEYDRRLQTFVPREGVGSVIVLGPTGVGKTTLIHLLAGKQLRAKKKNYALRVEADRLSEDFHISHGAETGTKYPAVWFDESKNRYLVDCPGFDDVRGSNAEVVNAISIEKILKNRKNAKIVLVVDESGVDVRSEGLQRLLEHVCPLFGKGLIPMKSACLVMTKQRDIENIIDLTSILRAKLDTLTPHHPIRPLLESLVDNPNRISFLPFPTEESEYRHPEAFERVEAAIHFVTPSDFPAEMIRVQPNAKAREVMTGLAEELSGALSTYLQVQGTPAVIASVKDVVRKHQGALSDLRTQLHHLADEFDQLSQGTTLESAFVEGLERYMNLEELHKRIDQIRFLTQLGARKPHRADEWMKALGSVGNKIRRYAAGPELEFNGSSTYTLKGHLVGLSDVEQAIHRSPDSTLMRVFASNRFFVDKDLTAPGHSLAILAPYFEVPSEVTIDLSGLPGVDGTNGVDGRKGEPGGDGGPGHPGHNGGHFFGKGYSITNPKNLFIVSNGGQGGNGGNGGRGGDGEDGRDGDLQIVTSFNSYTTYGAEHRSSPLYNHRGKDGELGQPGGKFGLLGNGGKKGSVKVLLIDSEYIQVSNKQGDFGINGQPGLGGEGGKHGKDSQGTIIGLDHGSFGPDRGRAEDGETPDEPSSMIPREPAPSAPLDTMGILLSYEAFLNLKPLEPQTNEFAEIFPGLDRHELLRHSDSNTAGFGDPTPADMNEGHAVPAASPAPHSSADSESDADVQTDSFNGKES